jgi:signal transduction histidine kinase
MTSKMRSSAESDASALVRGDRDNALAFEAGGAGAWTWRRASAISRTIAEAHGGRLWVEPTRDGSACFKLTLKRPAPEELDDGD